MLHDCDVLRVLTSGQGQEDKTEPEVALGLARPELKGEQLIFICVCEGQVFRALQFYVFSLLTFTITL